MGSTARDPFCRHSLHVALAAPARDRPKVRPAESLAIFAPSFGAGLGGSSGDSLIFNPLTRRTSPTIWSIQTSSFPFGTSLDAGLLGIARANPPSFAAVLHGAVPEFY